MTSLEDKTETKSQNQLMFEDVFSEILDLQIVEGFFSAVERKFLQASGNTFDVKKAKDTLITLQELLNDGSDEDFIKSFKLLQDLLHAWRTQLKTRDLSIETQQIRRFCDEFKKPFDVKVFIALTRFYRTLPHSLFVQSKYDFVVTRAFLKPITLNNVRELKFVREDIIKELNNLHRSWNIHSTSSGTISENEIEIITKFDEFVFEAEFITTFEELVKSRLFESLRDFKSEIGILFYHPLVTASAIECNVFVGNIFAELLAQENEKLSRIISNQFDFASVLHDTSPTAGIASNEILDHIRTDNLSQSLNLDDDATQIWEWLQTVCAHKPKENKTEDLEEISEIILPAKQRITHILSVVSHPNSDKTLLFEYLQKSPALKTLEAGIFFSPDTSEAQGGIFRATLNAILWSEEIRNHELMSRDKLSDESSNEISFILEELQTLSEQLKAKIDELESEVTHNLLYVSNQLLEARLKLERAIIRYSKQNLDEAKAAEETPEFIPPVARRTFNVPRFRVNFWLAALTVLVAVFSFGAYFFVSSMDNGVKVSKDVEIIATKDLPGNENLKSAQRVRDVLYVIAKDSWKDLSEDEQKIILTELLHFPAKMPITSVIVINSEGQEIGIASADQIETSAKIRNPISD